MASSRRAVFVTRALALLTLGGAVVGPAAAAPAEGKRSAAASGRARPRDQLLEGFDPRARALSDGRFVAKLPGGAEADLTVSPELEGFIAKLLRSYQVPAAGVVALEPSTGRVLAYVSHAKDPADDIDRVRDASAPAASVFKLVTGAALLVEGVRPETSTCYHGGAHALGRADLADQPKLDSACASLTGALSFSINAIFAKLALKHLSAPKLSDFAAAFGFGEPLPFDAPVMTSAIDVPSEPLEFARTAAGFWHMHMSPLHGALIGASIAQRGRMMRPYIVDRVRDAGGRVLIKSEPQLHRTVLEKRHADALARMMRGTVSQGTARKSFFDPRGQPYLPGIDVAGKTGTLSEERPYRGYTWWVGFAPADAPRIAIAVLVINSPKWRIKAPFVGREAMRHYLVDMPRRKKLEPLAKAL
jgi:peptidoglycan glycosyltransferase